MRLFLDLDGCVCDFHGQAAKEFGITPDQFTGWEIWEPMGISEKTFWSWLAARSREWWADLPLYPWAKGLVEMVGEFDPDYRILTTPSKGNSTAGKIDWVERHFGDQFHRMHFTKNKADLAGPCRLLIDDVDANCEAFSEAGGKFILFPQSWNKARDVYKPRLQWVADNLEYRKEWLCQA